MRYSDEEGIAFVRILNWIDSNNLFPRTRIELGLDNGTFDFNFRLTDKSVFEVGLDQEHFVLQVRCNDLYRVIAWKLDEPDKIINILTEWKEKCVQKGYLR